MLNALSSLLRQTKTPESGAELLKKSAAKSAAKQQLAQNNSAKLPANSEAALCCLIPIPR